MDEHLIQLRATLHTERAEEVLATALPSEPFPESPFAANRRRLNEALLELRHEQLSNNSADCKFAGVERKVADSVACSSVKWQRIESVYDYRVRLDVNAFPVHPVNPADIAGTVGELKRQLKFSGPCKGQNESWRKISIGLFLHAAAGLLDDEAINVRTEAQMSNAAVSSSDIADMLVSRNKKRKLLVVEAKKEDFDQGKAQDLVLMEIAIAENEKEGVRVTPRVRHHANFLDWDFYRYDADGISFAYDQINELRSLEEDTLRIIRIVYNMLKEE